MLVINKCTLRHIKPSHIMKVILYSVSFISLLTISCNQRNKLPESQSKSTHQLNMSKEMITDLNWMNASESFKLENNVLKITVTEGTDFFNNPEDSSVVGSAPYLYKDIKGDFIAKALVEPDFSAQWNAVALMIHIDSLHWIKFAFENSDATGPSIVSVVTKGVSDDANGAILNDQEKVWLSIARKGNIYAMHWSVDGKNFKMARLTSMIPQDPVKIGIEAQSPVGKSAVHQIHYFEIAERTVLDLRSLNN